MKHLFLLHGMGSNPPGWSASVVQTLDELASNYNWFKSNGNFKDQVVIHELRYDDVLEQYVHDWRESADALREAGNREQKKLRIPKTLMLLNTSVMPEDDKSVFWTTLIDPILYRGFTEARQNVRATVMNQIVNAINAADQGAMVEASVLCHSQGTIVGHDVLHLLGSQPVNGNNSFMPPQFSFDSVFMLANVSRLGPYDVDPYTSCVRPGTAPVMGAGNYCRRLYSFRHRWDPFTFWQTFAPTGWGDDFLCEPILTHVHSANVHGFTHYLSHPEVHVPIFNRLVSDPRLGRPVIDRKERRDAVAQFPSIQPTACALAIDTLKTRCEELIHAVQNPKDLDEIIPAGLGFYQAVRLAQQACPGLGSGQPV